MEDTEVSIFYAFDHRVSLFSHILIIAFSFSEDSRIDMRKSTMKTLVLMLSQWNDSLRHLMLSTYMDFAD